MRAVVRALAALVSVVSVISCSGQEPGPTELCLADLVRFAEGYNGERIATTGSVRSHSDPEHYWIEDTQLNRVEVRPQYAVSSLAGESVRIVGRFRHPLEQGRSMEAESTKLIAD